MTAPPDTEPAPAEAEDHPPVTALEMALDWAQNVHMIADYWQRRRRTDPDGEGMVRIQEQIHGAGRQQFESAQMASFMALVSIAEDLHAIRQVMLGQLPGRVAGDDQEPDPAAEAARWAAAEGADD